MQDNHPPAKTSVARSTIASFGSGLLHLFFPRLCEGCKKSLVSGEEVICLTCETFLAQTNYHHIPDNETALRLSGRIPFIHATSLGYFTNDGLLQHLIHGLKYKRKEPIGTYLGHELGKALRPLNWQIDAIIPVPLYKKKEFIRGFNQSTIIAHGIADVLNIPVLEHLLVRTRHTESQTDKSREDRISNVANAFAVQKAHSPEGKHILLVDDVLTTGATIESAALALLEVKNIKISIATAGIAV